MVFSYWKIDPMQRGGEAVVPLPELQGEVLLLEMHVENVNLLPLELFSAGAVWRGCIPPA